jgi:hypothetical protein
VSTVPFHNLAIRGLWDKQSVLEHDEATLRPQVPLTWDSTKLSIRLHGLYLKGRDAKMASDTMFMS